MSLLKPLQVIIRPWVKKQALKRMLTAPIKNSPVICVHRFKTTNAGDFQCGPHHYFPELHEKVVDLMDYKHGESTVRNHFIAQINQHALIIGGGGLLNRNTFKKQMELFKALAEKGKKIVLWGVGHNDGDEHIYGKLNHYVPDISKFGLTGTRDYSMPGEWVPCVSALHPLFDQSYKIARETGVVFHHNTIRKSEVVRKFTHIDSTANTADFPSLIQFIGSSENIITSSYHVMYWSMLMGKKVVAVPNSSKFFDFKYPPVISSFDEALSALSKAQVYDGLLEECREINHRFAQKAFDYLGL